MDPGISWVESSVPDKLGGVCIEESLVVYHVTLSLVLELNWGLYP